jgi:hypothetical protein
MIKFNREELARSTPDSRPGELLVKLAEAGDTVYSDAYTRGENLSLHLEGLDPSKDHGSTRLDAFGRLVRAAGIMPVTMPEIGLRAHPLQKFEEHEGTRVLIPEFIARQWRKAVTGRDPSTRAVYLTTDNAAGSVQQPISYATTPRYQQIAPAIPLNELVAFNTGIDSGTYQSFYLAHDVEASRMKRVVEATEVPAAKLVGQDRTVRLVKFGRRLDTSYEVLRRMPIDLVAFHIQRLAVQAEADKVSTVVGILVSGDGNPNTAATVFAQTALHAGSVAGTLTLRAWLAFKMKFKNPYMLTTVLSQESPALDLQLLNVGSANIPLVMIAAGSGFGGFRPINPGLADNVALGWIDDAPTSQIVGFDARFAVERVFEIGANIQEVQKWVTKQVNTLVMTETEGYAVLDANAVKILNIAG